MTLNNDDTALDADPVVDLGPLAAACRGLVGWYDQLLAGMNPSIGDLDAVIDTLRQLPTTGGRVGRDIDLIVSGGSDATRADVIAALERLRLVGSHEPAGPVGAPNHDHRSTSPITTEQMPQQHPLPGF